MTLDTMLVTTRDVGHMHAGIEKKQSAFSFGAGLQKKSPSFVDTNIKELNAGEMAWWANEIASTLRSAVEGVVAAKKDEAGEEGDEADRDIPVSIVTQRITRQLTEQIPASAYAPIVGSIRGMLKVVDASSKKAVHDLSEQPVGFLERSTGSRMAEIVGLKVPQEICKLLAKEIFNELVAQMRLEGSGGRSSDSLPSNADDEVAMPSPLLNTNSPITPGTDAGTSFSSETCSPCESEIDRRVREERTAVAVETTETHIHRLFYVDNDNMALQADCFKKFLMVLVSGNGFRVVKHNHKGGQKMRVLKYNPDKKEIFWESSRMGGGVIDCTHITRVNRCEAVVYVWHQKPKKGAEKKMIGFETQREYDARILELALRYMINPKNAGASS